MCSDSAAVRVGYDDMLGDSAASNGGFWHVNQTFRDAALRIVGAAEATVGMGGRMQGMFSRHQVAKKVTLLAVR